MTVRRLLIPKRMWPGALLSANDRPRHHLARGDQVRGWRHLGLLLARDARLPPIRTPVLCLVEFRFPTNHLRDTANLYPTAKALLDGIVQAGTIQGDHDDVLVGPWLLRAYPNGAPSIRLTLRPLRHLSDVTALVRRLTDDDLRTDHPTVSARADARLVPATRSLGAARVRRR